MKKYLLIFLYLNLSFSVFGQTDTIFQKRDIIQRINTNFGRSDTTYKLLDSIQTIISKKDTSKLQVRRFYSNDVLRSEVDFYGDSLHGNNLYYHDNGKLAIKKRYLNDKLVGEVKKYDSLGNQILPAFIPQKRVYNVWNQTELKVYLMYEQTDKMQIRALDFRGWLPDGKICESNTGKLIFKIEDETIVLRQNGVELHQGKKYGCKNRIETTQFDTNYKYTKGKKGYWNVSIQKEKVSHPISFGDLVVNRQQPQCQDTGTNPVKIIQDDGKFLFLKEIDNIHFFEYDIDKNGEKELYIFSYASCESYLKVYKVVH